MKHFVIDLNEGLLMPKEPNYTGFEWTRSHIRSKWGRYRLGNISVPQPLTRVNWLPACDQSVNQLNTHYAGFRILWGDGSLHNSHVRINRCIFVTTRSLRLGFKILLEGILPDLLCVLLCSGYLQLLQVGGFLRSFGSSITVSVSTSLLSLGAFPSAAVIAELTGKCLFLISLRVWNALLISWSSSILQRCSAALAAKLCKTQQSCEIRLLIGVGELL